MDSMITSLPKIVLGLGSDLRHGVEETLPRVNSTDTRKLVGNSRAGLSLAIPASLMAVALLIVSTQLSGCNTLNSNPDDTTQSCAPMLGHDLDTPLGSSAWVHEHLVHHSDLGLPPRVPFQLSCRLPHQIGNKESGANACLLFGEIALPKHPARKVIALMKRSLEHLFCERVSLRPDPDCVVVAGGVLFDNLHHEGQDPILWCAFERLRLYNDGVGQLLRAGSHDDAGEPLARSAELRPPSAEWTARR